MSNIADSNNEPPPVPPTVIPSVVDTLDPDLAAAYRSGNPTIIQAVNSGMTTNAMIVNEVIRMGGGMTGLPPAIQIMVTERQKEMTEQADAENARLKALAAGVVGLGMMGSNIAKGGEYYGGEGGAKTNANFSGADSYKSYSAQEWFSMSTEKQNEELRGQEAAAIQRSDASRVEMDTQSQDILNDPKYGATPEERKAALARIQRASSDVAHGNNVTPDEANRRLDDGDYAIGEKDGILKTPAEVEAAKKMAATRIAKEQADNEAYAADSGATYDDAGYKLKQYQRNTIARKEAEIEKAMKDGGLSREKVLESNPKLALSAEEAALKADDDKRFLLKQHALMNPTPENMAVGMGLANATMSVADAEKKLGVTADQLAADAAAAKKVSTNVAPAATAPDSRQATADLEEAGAAAKTADQKAAVNEARKEDVAVGAAIANKSVAADIAAAKANSVASTVTGSDMEDEPSGARPATVTASALGANGTAGLAQLGAAPTQQVAANDAPEVAPQRKPAQPSQGMGGAA